MTTTLDVANAQKVIHQIYLKTLQLNNCTLQLSFRTTLLTFFDQQLGLHMLQPLHRLFYDLCTHLSCTACAFLQTTCMTASISLCADSACVFKISSSRRSTMPSLAASCCFCSRQASPARRCAGSRLPPARHHHHHIHERTDSWQHFCSSPSSI